MDLFPISLIISRTSRTHNRGQNCEITISQMFLSPTLEEIVKLNGLSRYPHEVHTSTETQVHIYTTESHVRKVPHGPQRTIHRRSLREAHAAAHSEIRVCSEVHTQAEADTGTHGEAFAIRHVLRG